MSLFRKRRAIEHPSAKRKNRRESVNSATECDGVSPDQHQPNQDQPNQDQSNQVQREPHEIATTAEETETTTNTSESTSSDINKNQDKAAEDDHSTLQPNQNNDNTVATNENYKHNASKCILPSISSVITQTFEAEPNPASTAKSADQNTHEENGTRLYASVSICPGDDRKTKSSSAINPSHSFDYQQNICKDFRKKGYCRYGDECKFVHEREYEFTSQPEHRRNFSIKPAKSQTLPKPTRRPSCGENDTEKCAVCCNPPQNTVRVPCGHLCCEVCFIESAGQEDSKCSHCSEPIKGSAEFL